MEFKINNTTISRSGDPYIIAEACDNHFGNIDYAIKMIEESKKAGASAVKFQHHLPDEKCCQTYQCLKISLNRFMNF